MGDGEEYIYYYHYDISINNLMFLNEGIKDFFK